jgi:hypothetical protein
MAPQSRAELLGCHRNGGDATVFGHSGWRAALTKK